MSSRDAEKRRGWEARLERYRASGLSVARFCREEGVAVHTFYYWAKQLGTDSGSTPSRAGGTALPRASVVAKTAGDAAGAVVRFRWEAGVEVVVPAGCLGALRCLAECLVGADGRSGQAFQEVVVKS